MGTMTRMLSVEPARPQAVREHPWAPWLAVGIVGFGAFMGQLDASIVTLAFPALQHRFHAGLAEVQWVSLSYLLVLVALLVPVGRWSDRGGRKLLYLYGFALFSVASLACGLAPSLSALIGFRMVQAAGAAMLQANSIALVSTSVGPALRRKALGLQAVAQATGLAFGPTIGGLIVGAAGWRWVFLVNPPVGLLAIVGGVFLLPRTRQHARHTASDVPGVVLLTGTVAGLLLALSAGSGLRISAPGLIAVAALTAAGGAGLLWWERRTARPVLDRAVLTAPGAARGLAGALAAYLILFGPLVLYPQLLSSHQRGITGAGLLLTALPAGFALSAVLAERALPAGWADHLRCRLGGVITVLAAGLLTVVGSSAWLLTVLLLALLGTGLGIYLPANNAQVMGAVPATSAATAGGMVNMSRGIGTALGVALVAMSLHLTRAAGGLAAGGRLTMVALTVCAVLMTVVGSVGLRGPVRLPAPPDVG